MTTNYLLKQSAKKIIFLTIIIPILIQLILINLAQIVFDNELLYYMTFVFFWMLYLPYFYWLNISVIFLYKHSNKYFKLKLVNFKISLFVNIITILNFVFFVAYIFSFLYGGKPNFDFISFMILLQFAAIVSYFYNSYFICKLITTISLNRKVSFMDFNNIFIFFAFPPFAISCIQSKINKMQIE